LDNALAPRVHPPPSRKKSLATRFAAMHNINSVDDLAVFEQKDIENMIKLWNQYANNVKMKLGMGIQKKVQAWIFWAAKSLPLQLTG
jgi:hypothetical protein